MLFAYNRYCFYPPIRCVNSSVPMQAVVIFAQARCCRPCLGFCSFARFSRFACLFEFIEDTFSKIKSFSFSKSKEKRAGFSEPFERMQWRILQMQVVFYGCARIHQFHLALDLCCMAPGGIVRRAVRSACFRATNLAPAFLWGSSLLAAAGVAGTRKVYLLRTTANRASRVT